MSTERTAENFVRGNHITHRSLKLLFQPLPPCLPFVLFVHFPDNSIVCQNQIKLSLKCMITFPTNFICIFIYWFINMMIVTMISHTEIIYFMRKFLNHYSHPSQYREFEVPQKYHSQPQHSLTDSRIGLLQPL